MPSPAPPPIKLPSFDKVAQSFSIDQLDEILRKYKVLGAWQDYTRTQMALLERVSQIPAGASRFADEINFILESKAKERALEVVNVTARRVNYSIQMGGDVNRQFTRLGEDDEKMCKNCIVLEGEEGTLAEHAALGLPGPASCYGGHNCRCELVVIE